MCSELVVKNDDTTQIHDLLDTEKLGHTQARTSRTEPVIFSLLGALAQGCSGVLMNRTRAALAAVYAAALFALASALPSTASAQTSWPQRNVRFVVPLGPGSGADI